MIFADLFFIYLFLPLCLGLYFFSKNKNYRNAVLILFSLVFYAWGEPIWVVLLLFSALVDYFNGLFIEKFYSKRIAILGVISSLVINLGLFAVFKYSGFFVENINALFNISLNVPKFDLPIGISFYTFQTISYTIDVYRGNVKAQRSFPRFMLYVSLFFQLVAGPIVRYSTVAREIDNRVATTEDFSNGFTRFIVGMGKKVIISNSISLISDKFLANGEPISVFSTWLGVIAFSLHLYYDFSGYSDMAIGLGNMVGFHFNENFVYPYISRSATEFWRRWHISLGSFFRDYLYIPLGGNRKHQFLNLFIVWFLTGLWHGASWNFIIWGLYFGLLIAVEKLFLGEVLKKIPRVFSHFYLIFVALISWEIFYFTDTSVMLKYLGAMFGVGVKLIDEVSKTTFMNNIFLLLLAALFCMPIVEYAKRFSSKFIKNYRYGGAVIGTAQIIISLSIIFISTIFLVGETHNPFLYFRF